MSTALVKAEALQRARQALALIEQAQHNLTAACEQLSSLRAGAAKYSQTRRLTDNVHAHWYRVRKLLHSKRLTLDDTNAKAFLRNIGAQHHAE